MKVLITGGAGFLGARLARALLSRGELTVAEGEGGAQTIDQLVLLDVAAATGFEGDARVTVMTGDIAQPAVLDAAIDRDTAAVFHLAAIVSGQAEAEFELGMRINLDASRLLLERCRALGHRPRVVFTSSVAVYGGVMPELVRDDTALNPQSSYGTQKAIAELLLSDFTRRGFVDGRVLRLPTISVRPGRPNAATTSFASGIVREPLNGETAVIPVPRDLRIWLLSPRRAIDCLIAGCELDSGVLGTQRAVNLPGVSASVDEMLAALREVAGDAVAARVEFREDERIARIVGSFPARWDTTRARSLGLEGDASFAEIVRRYIEDEGIQPVAG